jgi:hypothetical protein|tara:strand:- start:1093 stop:1425 length:333 start_codon:yes stop_codon:yes gene_type:complete
LDRDNAKARRESGFNEDDDVNDDDEEEEELVSKKRRRLFLRRLGSQFRVNARSEMDIEEEEEDALTTFLCCKKRLLIGKGHSSSSHREDVTCFPRRSMETNATIIALGGQ